MHVNKISFKLSSEIFAADKYPTRAVEIYIDGENLHDIISGGCSMWPDEIYRSLMRVCFLKDEPVNIFVCGCGCVGCGDTEVHIEEMDNFVIWHDFVDEHEHVAPGLIFIFDKEQYYCEIDKILQWVEDARLAYYIGNAFTVWSDDNRLRYLADNLHRSCIMKSDFNEVEYWGKNEVLQAFKQYFIAGTYEEKAAMNYLYRVHGYEGERVARGYNKWYLELCRHDSPYRPVMYVVFKTDDEGKITRILLSRNQEWFKPYAWETADKMRMRNL